jgi:hypothetical protein
MIFRIVNASGPDHAAGRAEWRLRNPPNPLPTWMARADRFQARQKKL